MGASTSPTFLPSFRSPRLIGLLVSLPATPSLKRLTLDAPVKLLPAQEELLGPRGPNVDFSPERVPQVSEVSAGELMQLIFRIGVIRPVLRLRGIVPKHTSLGLEDPSYLALLEAVDSIEYDT
ncbi:hypothetical protein EXIGLDRAFT_722121 [Exidia glandulosa HHB12029]|uniref:Uncharacterized protein n=1 Tax=Exidia glandulosa HHB12029 TaxID=1314781 RepID=A0A165FG85_EXIGL|nr:hypothetical protein EXIGLDRAFT_722121 [Exidia glandulosa HHB12029]